MEDKAAAKAAHRAAAHEQLSPIGRKLFKYIEFDSDEELIAEIRKHPVGLIITGIIGILISLAVLISSISLGLYLENLDVGLGDNSTAKTLIVVFGLILTTLALGVTAISLVLYVRNVIYVTDEKIAEVAYLSLFNRKVTQLSLGQVEDVTFQQRGIFAHIFNFGTVVIETAGELENCTFTLVPNPNKYAQIIIEAHEASVHKYGN